VKAARLDGGRLVLARPGVLEVYDAVTGAAVLQRPLPPGYTLTDVDGGIAVLRHARTILVLRLDDGRSFMLTPARGPVLADLEGPGLYYSYATPKGRGRLVFVPRSELDRQFGSPAQVALDSAAGKAATGADWLLLSSNRDGKRRTYSVAADGSRLTPLFPLGVASSRLPSPATAARSPTAPTRRSSRRSTSRAPTAWGGRESRSSERTGAVYGGSPP
jgi:hypothetical protein